MWKRRHHCRKCGEVVCGDHSSHKELLPHINERVKQRICDKCFKGESDDRHSQTITTANVLNLSTNPFVDNNPSTTSKAVETTVAPASLKIEPAVSPKPVPKPVTPIKRATSPVPVKAASPASKPVASSVKPSTTATAAEVVLKDKAATSPMRARVEKPMQNNSDSSLSEKEQPPDYLANKKPGKLNSQLLNPFAGVTDERAVSPTNLAKSSSTSPLRAKSPELPTKPNKLKVETINNFSNNSKSTATPPGKPSKLSPSALNAFSQTTQSQKIVEPAKAREKSPVRLPKSPPPLPIAPPPLPTTPPPAIPSFVSRVDDAQEASSPFPGSTEQRASNKGKQIVIFLLFLEQSHLWVCSSLFNIGRRGTTFRGTQRAAPPPPPLEDEATQVVGAVSLSSENPFGPKIVAEKDKSDIKDASRELPVVGVVIPAPPPMAPPVLPPAQDLLKGPEIQAQQPTIARPVAPPPLKPAPPTIKPPPPKKDGDAPPVKVPPPPPMPKIEDHPADSSSSEIDEDPVLKKYKKMKEMLPEGAVRQKMMSDGFSSLDIDSFMAGKPISLSPTSPAGGGSVADMLASAPALKSVVPSAPAAPVNKRMSIMDEIQQGARLKAVKLDDARMKAPAIQGKGGLLGMISQQMTQRRLNMKVEEDSDSDSSGGFDESSSEED